MLPEYWGAVISADATIGSTYSAAVRPEVASNAREIQCGGRFSVTGLAARWHTEQLSGRIGQASAATGGGTS